MTSTVMESPATIRLSDLPAIGGELAGGKFGGLTTRKDGTHCAVALLSARPSERLDWKASLKWCDEVGGEPMTRPVGALLYATLKDQFDPDWHWLADEYEYDGSYAWSQGFYGGRQHVHHKSYERRSRAVRLIPLVL